MVPGVTAFDLAGEQGRYRLAGVATFANARALLERGTREFAGQSVVELDLSGVTAADSAGLAVLLAWLQQARGAGHTLVFRGLPDQLLSTARVCGVEPLLGLGAPGA